MAASAGVNLLWFFTKSGHSKNIMEGVRGGNKMVVCDTVAYNPYGVIQNTNIFISLVIHAQHCH